MDTITRTFVVLLFRLDLVYQYIARFNSRCLRLGMPGAEIRNVSDVRHISYTIVDPDTHLLRDVVLPVVDVEMTGNFELAVNGWTIVAKVEHMDSGNMIYVFGDDGDIIIEKYGKSSPVCEHCHTNRRRSVTHVLRNDGNGELKQVGSDCLNEFLGVDLADMVELVRFAESLGDIGDDDWGAVSNQAYPVVDVVAKVMKWLENHAWVSKGKADELRQPSTAESVRSNWGKILVSDSDRNNAAELCEHVRRELSEKDGILSEYEHNMYVLLGQQFVGRDKLGYLCSAVPLAKRIAEKKAELERALCQSPHIGTVGQKRQFDSLTCIQIDRISGFYGDTYLHKFTDVETGALVVWFSTSWVGEVGTVYSGKATIKEHGVFASMPQTVITRAKLTAK